MADERPRRSWYRRQSVEGDREPTPRKWYTLPLTTAGFLVGLVIVMVVVYLIAR